MLQLDKWQQEVLEAKGNICLCSGRQVGKSTVVAIKAADFAIKNPKKLVLIISVTEKQSEELLLKILLYIQEKYPKQIKTGKDRPTKKALRLKNGSVIRCEPVGQTGTGVRGFTVSLLIADEAAFMNQEIFQAITPMILTTGGDIILVSTPKGKQGYFWECYNSEDFKTFHVNSEEVIQNREISESWSQIQRIKALEHLEREKRLMTHKEYAQEYLGQFVEELSRYFTDELISQRMTQKLGSRPPSPNNTYFIGVDVARMGTDESTFQIVQRSDNKIIHVYSEITTKTLTTDTVRKILELNKIYDFRKIYVDDGGLGVAVFDQLLMEDETKRKVVALNNAARPLDRDDKKRKKILKEDLYNNLLRLMERGEIELLEDDNLALSLKSIQYEYVMKEGSPTRLRIFGSYSHIAEGLIRAAWCARDKSLNVFIR